MIYQKPKEATKTEKLLLDWLPLVGTVAMVISYLPQLWLTYTTHNVEGQSTGFCAILSFALLTMFLQQLGLLKYRNSKTYTGLVFQGLNLLLAVAMLVGVLLFS